MQPELHVDPNIYSRPFPNFERPKIIGYIGLENLKFLNQPSNRRVNFDLNTLLEEAKHKPDDLDVKLNDLIQFLAENKTRLKVIHENTLEKVPFYCYRGLMTCVACTPYENKDPWKIVAILYKGSIYLCARDTEEKKQQRLNVTERDRRFTSWGYKFEQYLLSDSPESKPNPNVPVDETEEFSLVFTTRLNSHTIVYGAEMDGIKCDTDQIPPPPAPDSDPEEIIKYLSSKTFVELKTNRHLEFPRQQQSFRRFKTKKWWCQSFLVGIDTIICGSRNDDGIVEELKTYSIRDLTKMSQKFWNPSVCFNFLDNFLIYVKRCFAREISRLYGREALGDLSRLPLTTLLFEWSPGAPVRVGSCDHSEDPILPQWFLDSYAQ